MNCVVRLLTASCLVALTLHVGGCDRGGEAQKAQAQAELEAARGGDPNTLTAKTPASGGVPESWGVGEGQGCAWAWDAPKDVDTHMRAAAQGIEGWTPAPKGAGSKKQHAQWDRLLDVAIQHASVTLAAQVSDPSAAQSPDGTTSALDAAWKATDMLDAAVRANTPEGEVPGWKRWPELTYLREVLQSMAGNGPVQAPAKSAGQMRFVPQGGTWRPRIDLCRLHRLERNARK